MTELLQDLVARQAELRPEATALVYGAKRLSYGELDAAANRLARALVEKPAACAWSSFYCTSRGPSAAASPSRTSTSTTCARSTASPG
jgi:non-ribosomal peptide synthetase component F